MVVAERTRNRRAAGEVLIDERAHNVLLESLFLIDDVIGNAQLLGHVARVVYIVKRTAPASLGRVGNSVPSGKARLIPELQREAHHRLAGVGEHRCSR
jgi:hypothetical protein